MHTNNRKRLPYSRQEHVINEAPYKIPHKLIFIFSRNINSCTKTIFHKDWSKTKVHTIADILSNLHTLDHIKNHRGQEHRHRMDPR